MFFQFWWVLHLIDNVYVELFLQRRLAMWSIGHIKGARSPMQQATIGLVQNRVESTNDVSNQYFFTCLLFYQLINKNRFYD